MLIENGKNMSKLCLRRIHDLGLVSVINQRLTLLALNYPHLTSCSALIQYVILFHLKLNSPKVKVHQKVLQYHRKKNLTFPFYAKTLCPHMKTVLQEESQSMV